MLVSAVAACGGTTRPPATLHNTADAHVGVAAADALALVERLATALDKDDAAALPALVDPSGGIRVWHTPGVVQVIDAHITAGGGAPSKQLASDDPDMGHRDSDAQRWVALLRGALAVVDIEPAHPDDPKYHDDCETNAGPTRAMLRSKPDLHPDGWPYYSEDKIDRNLGEVVYRLDFGAALTVLIINHGGRLYISDLITADACSA